MTLSADMEEASRAALVYPHRVLAKSGHSVGKTCWCAGMVNWHYDSFNPSETISTAPTKRDVEDLLWKEVRIQRTRAGLPSQFIGPSAPEMRSAPNHYAKGFTAGNTVSFQGRHEARMMFVFDEAAGIKPGFWETTKTMWKPELGHIWLAILNPTDTTTQAYMEDNARARDGKPAWRSFSWSCLNHPNVIAQLKGLPPPVPPAVSLAQVNGYVTDWCTPISFEERTATDICWPPLLTGQPPEDGTWYRPGPLFESRCMGRWPSQGTYGVWSDSLWLACTTNADGEPRDDPVPLVDLPQIGCDVARFGDDNTASVVRWGNSVLECQSANGWNTMRTAGHLIGLAEEYAEMVNIMRKAQRRGPVVAPTEIQIKVDNGGADVGSGVVDRLMEQGYNAISVGAGDASLWPSRYRNKRSELWFLTADRARMGMVSMGRLDRDMLHRLKSEAMAPVWAPNSAGQKEVESKDDTKEKLGHSPDLMDALNLAFSENVFWEAPVSLPAREATPRMGSEAWYEGRNSRRGKRKLFGR